MPQPPNKHGVLIKTIRRGVTVSTDIRRLQVVENILTGYRVILRKRRFIAYPCSPANRSSVDLYAFIVTIDETKLARDRRRERRRAAYGVR